MKKLYFLLVTLIFSGSTYAQGTWSSRADFGGTERYRAVSFSVGDKCYVGTGALLGGVGNNLQDIWEYDPALNTWSQKADLAGPKRTNATGASDSAYGYIGLGTNATTSLNDWWQYDPVANTWVQKTSFPSSPRYGAGSFTINNRIYVGGGIDSANIVYSDFFVYDPTSDTWTGRQNLLTPVTSMATFVIGSKGYFTGGATNGGVSATNQHAEYDPVMNSWTLKAPFAGGNIYSCVGFSLNGTGFVGTGFSGNLTNILYSFDPVANTWTQETNFPAGMRQWAVSCNINNRAFVGTGNSTGGNIFNDWWEFASVTTNVIDDELPSVTFDQVNHQLIIRGVKGNEICEIYSINGKLISKRILSLGINYLELFSKGIILVRINSTIKKLVVS